SGLLVPGRTPWPTLRLNASRSLADLTFFKPFHMHPSTRRYVGCVKEYEQSVVFFFVVTLPVEQHCRGVRSRSGPGCGTRVWNDAVCGCRTPRYSSSPQTWPGSGCGILRDSTFP